MSVYFPSPLDDRFEDAAYSRSHRLIGRRRYRDSAQGYEMQLRVDF
jgi:hypothetical protein